MELKTYLRIIEGRQKTEGLASAKEVYNNLLRTVFFKKTTPSAIANCKIIRHEQNNLTDLCKIMGICKVKGSISSAIEDDGYYWEKTYIVADKENNIAHIFTYEKEEYIKLYQKGYFSVINACLHDKYEDEMS